VLFATLERFVSVAESGDSRGSLGTREGFPQESQDSEASSLPHLSTIDSGDGLARVGGKIGFFLELLARFAEDHRGDGDRIAAALERGDAGTAELLAHGLKGVAGNIGATAIQKATSGLEDILRHGEDPLAREAALVALRAALAATLDELEPIILARFQAKQDVRLTSPERMAAILAELGRLVEDFDLEAVNYFKEMRSELLGSFGEERLAQLEARLTAYEYEEAARWLRSETPS
ncbi:MAG: Hpt domain-containing protein, partial [Rectinemataceae bacterium]